MDDGRDQLFAAEDMTADRLDYGYATTVHRAQGATVDIAHRFHDGGGRELAYVAMSRARQQATVHVVADDVDQAVEDLQRDWAHERRPRWAIDTGTPETNALRAERSPDVAADLRPQPATRPARPPNATPAGACPHPKPPHRRPSSGVACSRPTTSWSASNRRSGPFDDPELTAAAHTLNAARNRRALAERTATAPGLNRRGRRRWEREAAASRAAEHDATTPGPPPNPAAGTHRPDPPARGASDRCPPNPPRPAAELDPSLEHRPRRKQRSQPSAARSRAVPSPLAATDRHPGPRPRAVASRSHSESAAVPASGQQG